MNIFDKTRELGLNTDEYVVFAGGVVVALGLLEWDEDIDMVVSQEVFDRFKAEGWEHKYVKNKDGITKLTLVHDVYDIGVDIDEWSLKDLQSDAMWIEGIPFMSIEKLLTWKRRMGRPKDLRHVALLEEYLKKQKQS